jgi:UDP-N-acetylmuramoyl-L-alanyl-D-glutamate--2,6-diaminopimelate ligase
VPADSFAVSAPARPRTVTPVALADLAARLKIAPDPSGYGGLYVTGMSSSSAGVQPGDLYAALPGARTHGARFVQDAVRAGAVAVLTDGPGARLAAGSGLPLLLVEEPRTVVGAAAACVYGDPGEAVTLVGVTGTQGKTTTTMLISAGLAAAGHSTAVVGTLGTRIGSRALTSTLTTPEATELHALLAIMREEGVEICAMEVSSHALVMGRVDGVTFDVTAFTNFGRDHLDFHGTVADYFAAKAGLFTPEHTRHALLNVDDSQVATLLDRTAVATSTYSPSGAPATWRGSQVRETRRGSSLTLAGPGGLRVPMTLPLAGSFNVANAVCAVACVGATGADARDLQAMADGIATVRSVPGRMEPVERGQAFRVFVDYAHKPDAVAATLRALRETTPGRVIIVIGAGGERDAGKRPLMGRLAAELADTVIVTDDNPRGEDPATIRAAVLRGTGDATERPEILEIGDRRDAIAAALARAAEGDTVLIAGKGHEAGQQIGDHTLPFDDRAVAAENLDLLAAGRQR